MSIRILHTNTLTVNVITGHRDSTLKLRPYLFPHGHLKGDIVDSLSGGDTTNNLPSRQRTVSRDLFQYDAMG